MDLTAYFKYFMKTYRGLDDYLVEIDGQTMHEWNYEDGCLFMGAAKMYKKTGDEEYLNYIEKMVSPYVKEDGTILSYHIEEYNLDFINAGNIFYFLYDITGEERYRRACETLMTQLRYQPRLTTGNFWHKLIYPFQVWLDGLYMGQPFYMEYENRWGGKVHYYDILNQFNQVRNILYDEKTSLYYHAYDEYKDRKWADKETGLSPNFWLRSIGWFLMALTDCYELADEELYDVKARLGELLRETIHGVLKYQDKESKLFYQLIALPEQEGNYLETSGSLMIAYSIIKGCRTGALLADKYLEKGKEIYNAVLEKKLYIDEKGNPHLSGTCAVAGLGPRKERDGSIAYYLSEPVVDDDVKAAGILMMTTAELLNEEG